ncbi:hypothetical protein C4561_00765 [candidate division WWE3 bacterium]|uniref:Uncharacterized protein n=1 Tax=candidate division WWE3 bacterium TaxID=2053526 RepID=A0A3A4ZG55_UNCKA|nr:MAG: hypothetical protein C4561_00765 [candidate division WWE3 bacterium]
MIKKILKFLGYTTLLFVMILFFYPKPAVSFPEGGWIPGIQSEGYVCECLGYRTPLVEYIDMGKGYKEELRMLAKCYGIPYHCADYDENVE